MKELRAWSPWAGICLKIPADPAETLALLDDFGSPATVATTGGRYFGFVIGGVLPAALAANWLAGAWDLECQHAGHVARGREG